MNGELLSALERIEREKGISKEILYQTIESALASAARKVIDDPDIEKEDITVNINKKTGQIEVFSEGLEIKNERFGRIAAQTAKQVIMQKIREAERDVVHEKYSKKIGSIINGSVHRFEKGNIIVELDDAEAVLPRTEQLPREKFRQGEGIRAYLVKVERGHGSPDIVLSRADAGFVKRLFELEVPEIAQGIVEIKSIAREAGERTKIAVCSKDEKIDPVGACVGMRGARVRDIVKELHGERIDIIKWNNDIREYLPAAVSPAEITRMIIDRENNTITLTVPKDQLSLLIGKKGRNIRLASKLLEWELIAEAIDETEAISLSEIPGISDKVQKALQEAGYSTICELCKLDKKELMKLKGIGEKTAEKILDAARTTLAEKRAKAKDEEAGKKKEEEAAQPEAAQPEAAQEEEKEAESGGVLPEKSDEGSAQERIDSEGNRQEGEE